MCGIAGFYSSTQLNNRQELVSLMSDQLKHRGPDKQGFCHISNTNISFIHTRLSIIDLSELANQPMVSHCQNYTLSFNGEIYNHLEIRTLLEKQFADVSWRSTSDTETLITSIALLGLDKTLDLLRGMYAFSLFDKKANAIFLVRDRFGEKPLYWYKDEQYFLWASELKALLAFNKNLFYVTSERIHEYLSYGYIKAPNSIFHNISKVGPGEYLKYSLSDNSTSITRYYSIKALASEPTVVHNNPVSELKVLLENAVKGTMLSDVPLGSFLSGGVDSSLITSIMASISGDKVNTFTLGFENSELDESKYAAEVANHLGTQHHQLVMGHQDVIDRIPHILSIIDEPIADSSIVPTFLLSEFTQKKVKVALSGDGADEIFLGYNRYFKGLGLWRGLHRLPKPINNGLLAIANSTPDTVLRGMIKVSQSQKVTDVSKKLATIRQVISSKDINDYNKNIRLKWPANALISSTKDIPVNGFSANGGIADVTVLSSYDQQFYLPDNILLKVDRSAMACSLETRAPFLNADVVRFAAGLEMHHKLSKSEGKLILKQLLSEYLPQYMINRPKKGFGLPISEWLKGALKNWVADLINSDSAVYSFIDKNKVRSIWNDHLQNKADHSEKIWTLITLVLWLEKYKPRLQ